MAKILIVDDSKLSRRVLRRILETENHEIIEVSDGVIAIEHYVIDRPDLVLLDLTMHDMQGMDVLIKLREIDGQARIVIATADVQRTTRAMVAYHGAAGFISKPFIAQDVLSVVSTVLSGGTDETG